MSVFLYLCFMVTHYFSLNIHIAYIYMKAVADI